MAETAACAPAPIATAVPADTARNAWRPWAGLAVMLTGTFMAVLDVFIVNIAIPDMRDTLEASFAELQFVIAAYGLTYRSEEHTSELQSLMRISYAVFCLKQKTHKQI